MKIMRRFSGLLLAFFLLVGLLPTEALAVPEKYGLKIAGVEITSDNWQNLPYKEAFLYMPASKTLVIQNDLTLTDSSVDTLIESSIDGLTINLWGNYTLTMNSEGGTLLKLDGDTTITTTANRDAGSLTLWNNSPDGTGILVNDCSLTLNYLFELDAAGVAYGLRGEGNDAALQSYGTAFRIESDTAAISGFRKKLEILDGEILTPENAKISGGDLCQSNGAPAPDVDIRNTAWADALTDTDGHDLLKQELNLSTIGELDPETGEYRDYDIDLMALYKDASENYLLTVHAFNLIRGSVPPGMSLVIGPSNAYPDTHTALRLRGRPTRPGNYVAGLCITGRTSSNYEKITSCIGNVRMTVTYESNNEYYDLWIDGIQADSDHRADLLGDGAFSYDPESNTLTIRGSYASEWPSALVRSKIDGLTVECPEDVTLSSEGAVFQLEKNTRFTGEGRLTVSSIGSNGIQVQNGAELRIKDADLAVEAAGVAVAGSDSSEALIVDNSHLSARGGTKAAAGFLGGITLFEPYVAIYTPEGGKVVGGSIVKGDGSNAPEVLIAPVRTYDLFICGIQVTERNRRDVRGDGVFSFDGDKTLHIKGDCTDANTTVILSGIDGLVISVDRDSVLASDPVDSMGYPMFLREATTITGPGRLTLKPHEDYAGLLCDNGGDLTLKDLVLKIENGNRGIQGSGKLSTNKLRIENSSVSVSINNDGCAAIQDFADGIELTGCVITQPENGRVLDGKIVNAGGADAGVVTISPQTPVTGLTLNKEIVNLAVGGSETLTATVIPENASLKTVSWSSGNPAVAEVDGNGRVTGKSVGEAVITARSNGGSCSKTCTVIVSPPVSVTGVTLNRTALSLPVGISDYLIPAISPSNATNKAVSWQSDNPAVATVTADGRVEAVAVGSAGITVKTKDGGKTAVCIVTVREVWSFDKAESSITVSNAVTAACPVIVASYNADWRFLGAALVTGAGKRTYVVKSGAKYITILWVEQATCKPKCAAEKITLD